MHRWLLAPFPILAGWMGCAYVFGDPIRTSSPSFAAAKTLWSMQTWGLIFLAGAAVMALCLILDDKQWLSRSLFVGGFIFTWWAALFGYTAYTDPKASLTGPAIHGTLGLLQLIASWWISRPTVSGPT